MMIHELKTWPPYYQLVVDGKKTFEVRKNDREYLVGDLLILQEYNPITSEYTGRSIHKTVDYILHGGSFGIEPGFVVMSLSNPTQP